MKYQRRSCEHNDARGDKLGSKLHREVRRLFLYSGFLASLSVGWQASVSRRDFASYGRA